MYYSVPPMTEEMTMTHGQDVCDTPNPLSRLSLLSPFNLYFVGTTNVLFLAQLTQVSSQSGKIARRRT